MTVNGATTKLRGGCIHHDHGMLGSAAFDIAEERKVAPPWMKGAWMRGDHYLTQLALPNFYFHVTTAYAILRNNGVDVGKMDFIGNMPMNPG